MIREKRYQTIAKEVCASACANMWLAGTVRWVNEGAVVGFHKSSDKNGKTDAKADAIHRDYYQWLGFSKETALWLNSAPPDDLNTINHDTARKYHIVFKVVDAPIVKEFPSTMTGMWCWDSNTKNYNHVANPARCTKDKLLTIGPNNFKANSSKGEDLECVTTEIHQLPFDQWRYKDSCESHEIVYLDEGKLWIRKVTIETSEIGVVPEPVVTGQRVTPNRGVATPPPPRQSHREPSYAPGVHSPRRVAARPRGIVLRFGPFGIRVR
jgi:hypothetical protein